LGPAEICPLLFQGGCLLVFWWRDKRNLRALSQHELGEGLQILDLSARGAEISEYHVEAAIAAVHASSPNMHETNWVEIASLYDTLMSIRPTPIVALNRAIAVGQRDGAKCGLTELRAIADAERLTKYPFYHAAIGEFELRGGRPQVAHAHFSSALMLSRNATERQSFRQRIEACDHGASRMKLSVP